MIQKALWPLVGFVFTLLLNSPMSQGATEALTKVKLALNWKAEPQFGGFYAAQLNGEFKKRGLDVMILEGGSGTPTVQMLGSEKVDFGIVSAEEIALAQDRGSQIVALFATYQTNPQAIMTHASRDLKSLKEVLNAPGILSLQKGLSYAQFLMKKYPQHQVRLVPYGGGITPFLKDPQYSQQCFFTAEPLLAEKAGVKVKTFLVAEEGFNPYTTVLATSANSLKNPKIAKSMVDAVRAGWEAYLKDPEPANKMMARINKSMDAETFTRSAAAQKSLIETIETQRKGLGSMSKERWEKLLQQLKDLKVIKKNLSPEGLYREL